MKDRNTRMELSPLVNAEFVSSEVGSPELQRFPVQTHISFLIVISPIVCTSFIQPTSFTVLSLHL